MASATRELRYHSGGAVDGSLARDLDWELRERELRHAGELPRRREKAKEQVRERQRVSPLAVVGFAAVVVLSVLMLMNYIQLMELSAETVELRAQLSALETENVTLTTQYERMFDRASVKEAAEAAGMAKPSSSQVYYIDLSEGDSAVVCRKEDPSVLSRLLTSLDHGIYAVVEYFH